MTGKSYTFQDHKQFYDAVNRLRDQGMTIKQACKQLDFHWSRYYKAKDKVLGEKKEFKASKPKASKPKKPTNNNIIYYDSAMAQTPSTIKNDIFLKIQKPDMVVTVHTTAKAAADLIREL